MIYETISKDAFWPGEPFHRPCGAGGPGLPRGEHRPGRRELLTLGAADWPCEALRQKDPVRPDRSGGECAPGDPVHQHGRSGLNKVFWEVKVHPGGVRRGLIFCVHFLLFTLWTDLGNK